MKKIISIFTIISISCALYSNKNTSSYPLAHFLRFDLAKCDNPEQAEKEWNIVRHIYKKHISEDPTYQAEPRIPYIIHQIWLGSPLPEKFKPLQESIVENHPDWQYILWTEKEIEALQLVNQEAYDKSDNFGEKSDIARYEILYRFGGVYFDIDVQCYQSFMPLHHYTDFYAGTSPYHNSLCAENCIIGSSVGNPVLKNCIEMIDPNQVIEGHINFQIIQKTGPGLLTRAYLHTIRSSDTTSINVLLPQCFFFKTSPNSETILAKHYWTGSWKTSH